MTTKFDRNSAKDKQPQDHDQWKIKAAETSGVERGKCEIERAAARYQPNFISIPEWADGLEHLAPLSVGARDKQVDNAGAQIVAVENHVSGYHQGDQAKPNSFEHRLS